MKHRKKKVLVGLSGGVDSSVAAFLLVQAGFDVEGVFLKNWTSTEGLVKADCPWIDDRRSALRAAAFLGIPMHTLDLEKEYSEKVMRNFFAEYENGNTPNPDVLCNEYIKFGVMYDWAMKRGFDFVATGHYARSAQISNFKFEILNKFKNTNVKTKAHSSPPAGGLTPHSLIMSRDTFKDQTYFLYRIKKEKLSKILFPIGGMTKVEVKRLAKKIGLPQADRKESMGLCFVGKVRLKDFLAQKIKSKKGKIVLLEEREKGKGKSGVVTTLSLLTPDSSLLTIGQHHGLENYTIGQRHGVDIAGSTPYYVLSKDLKKNILYVTSDPEDPRFYTKTVEIKNCNWLVEMGGLRAERIALSENQKSEIRNQANKNYKLNATRYTLLARFRHQGDLVPARIVEINKTSAVVEFQDKQKALASGQSLVLYLNDICLGGGVIG
jgi:tRNA-specific 2-thiouridylase